MRTGQPLGGVVGIGAAQAVLPQGVLRTETDGNARPKIQMERLGGKTIGGVYTDGTRITTTYPERYFGNDRPIVQVRETWMSPDLKMAVFSTDDDPRTGLRTTEMTDIDRNEPDPTIFQAPEGVYGAGADSAGWELRVMSRSSTNRGSVLVAVAREHIPGAKAHILPIR